MLLRILSCIVCIPAVLFSGLMLLILGLSLVHAPKYAAKKAKERESLIQAGERVREFFKAHQAFPSEEELEKMSSDLNSIHWVSLDTSRPHDPDFDFPEWKNPGSSFAVKYWVGEWFEYFNSETNTTTLDHQVTASFWVKENLKFLVFPSWFGVPSIIVLWIVFRRRPMSETLS